MTVTSNRPPSMAVELSGEKRAQLEALGLPVPVMYRVTGLDFTLLFDAKIRESQALHKYGASVYVYPLEEYAEMELYLTGDAMAGFAIKPDGDIVSVFSHPGSQSRGQVFGLLLLATEVGGTKLDCFDTVLPVMYSAVGFRETSRLTWDDNYMPEGWDKATFGKYNGGEPDVVFMEYVGFESVTLANYLLARS